MSEYLAKNTELMISYMSPLTSFHCIILYTTVNSQLGRKCVMLIESLVERITSTAVTLCSLFVYPMVPRTDGANWLTSAKNNLKQLNKHSLLMSLYLQ